MPHHHDDQRNQCGSLEKGLQAQRVAQGLVGAQAPGAQEEEVATSSTVIPSILEEAGAAETPSPPGSPEGDSSSPTSLHHSDEGSSIEEEEGPTRSVLQEALEERMSDLVHFLLLKYRFKDPITKAEMLNIVLNDYQDHFPEIFMKASECMQMVFGVDVKEVDPAGHSYVLVTTLGLTYYEELNDDQRFPKSGLLIIMLGLILFEGDCAPEEVIWEALGGMGVHAGSEHYIYGEPRKLITQDWVQEGYLEYRQVPDSDPACYEFLWGPRAHAETSKMKVLEYVLKVNRSDHRSFPLLYEESVRDEEEGA
uniref:MAGE domain-containing protein n=1 Tax=Microcebus murinus TaxID=30608 RepID=A0A8C6EJF0_MICMU